MKNKKEKKKRGFTLIELLAVIIILGILLVIAVPAVTKYINDSRKNSYINSAKGIINGAGTTYDSSHTDKEYARIDDPANGRPGYFTLKSN